MNGGSFVDQWLDHKKEEQNEKEEKNIVPYSNEYADEHPNIMDAYREYKTERDSGSNVNWDAILNKLTSSDSQGKSKLFRRIGIAAAIVILAIITLLLLKK